MRAMSMPDRPATGTTNCGPSSLSLFSRFRLLWDSRLFSSRVPWQQQCSSRRSRTGASGRVSWGSRTHSTRGNISPSMSRSQVGCFCSRRWARASTVSTSS
eukprot:Amastigsp_a845522_18.p4 type:complete len:101 gc:universal Amastigsp_a845522_18:531-229(-)